MSVTDDLAETRYRLSISLFISSLPMSPDEVTEHLGLKPTSVRLLGSPIRNSMMRRPEFDYHEWVVVDELQVPDGILKLEEAESFITGFLKNLEGVACRIRDLSENNSVMVELAYFLKEMPYVGLTASQVEAIAVLNARLAYDFYIYPES